MTKLTAEVISIGDEMTSGARLDTNSQWLSQRLGELGIEVCFHTTVGDSLAHNADVFRIACDRNDVVVTSGGLGPTRDDLTREVLASLVDEPLELRRDVLAGIETMFTSRGRVMAARNEVQAMFPKSANVIENPHGTAPGIDIEVERKSTGFCRVFALPGVPAEMMQMFDESVAPRLLSRSNGGNVIRHRVMKFFGTGESDMEQRLGEMIARDRVPRVGITVSAATLSLRITAMGQSEAECEAMISSTREEILERVGDLYFGEGEDFEQYHAIDVLLRNLNQSLFLVELGYAAPVGDWFASLGDAPAYRGGISLASIEQLLQFTNRDTLTEALICLKQLSGAQWVLLVDGYPSLNQSPVAQLPPTKFTLHLMTPDNGVESREHSIAGHPDIMLPRIGKMALAWMREKLS